MQRVGWMANESVNKGVPSGTIYRTDQTEPMDVRLCMCIKYMYCILCMYVCFSSFCIHISLPTSEVIEWDWYNLYSKVTRIFFYLFTLQGVIYQYANVSYSHSGVPCFKFICFFRNNKCGHTYKEYLIFVVKIVWNNRIVLSTQKNMLKAISSRVTARFSHRSWKVQLTKITIYIIN